MNPTPEQIAEKDTKDAAAGQRVQHLFADPAVKARIRELEDQCLTEFASADSDEKRRDVWARSRALRDIVSALVGIVNSGAVAERKIEIREQQAEAASRRQQGRTPRR